MMGVTDRRLPHYVSDPNRGRRKWTGKRDAQKVVCGNHGRIRDNREKLLPRRRGKTLERMFAHLLVTGGLRRVQGRGQQDIRKRMLVYAAAFNLGLVMRACFGLGTPRSQQGLAMAAIADETQHLGQPVPENEGDVVTAAPSPAHENIHWNPDPPFLLLRRQSSPTLSCGDRPLRLGESRVEAIETLLMLQGKTLIQPQQVQIDHLVHTLTVKVPQDLG